MDPLEKTMLAWSMNVNIDPATVNSLNTLKFKLALKLSEVKFMQRGLLSFRIVKYIFGIKFKFLTEKFEHYLQQCPIKEKNILERLSRFSSQYWKKDKTLLINFLFKEIVEAKCEKKPKPELALKLKPDLIQDILSPALFVPNQPINMQIVDKNWFKLAQDGDYYIRKSTSDPTMWRLCIAVKIQKVILVCSLQKQENGEYILIVSKKNYPLTGTLENVKEQLQKHAKVKLGRPLIPLLEDAKSFVISEPLIPKDELLDEMDDLQPVGIRTKGANELLSKLQNYNYIRSSIIFNDQPYAPIASNQFGFSTDKLISCGSSHKREFILVDFEHSPQLKMHFATLVKKLELAKKSEIFNLSTSKGVYVLLKIIRDYIRTEVFPSCKSLSLGSDLEQAIKDYQMNYPDSRLLFKNEKGSVSVVPIDYFVEKKLGVCRHHALVTAMLMDKLINEHKGSLIPKGIVQHVRDNITVNDTVGAHVWITLVEPNGTKWHIDTLWNIVEDFSNSTGIDKLKKMYGTETIDNQLAKANFALKQAQKRFAS